MNPFDYVTAASQTKKNLMRNTDNDTLAEKTYSAFLTNRSFSYHVDTISAANEMNMRGHVDNLLQFEFYLNKIRSKKRYAKWNKKDTYSNLQMVKEYFEYSDDKALQALKILSDNDLLKIKKIIDKGGRV
jgi:hypothetical protein